MCQVGAELFHADVQADMTKLIATCRNFCERTWKRCISCSGWLLSNEMTGCYIYECTHTHTQTEMETKRPCDIRLCLQCIYRRWLKKTRQKIIGNAKLYYTIKRKHITACANLLDFNYSTANRTERQQLRPLSKISCYSRPVL